MDDERANADPVLHLLDTREIVQIVLEECHTSATNAERAARRIVSRVFEFLAVEDPPVQH